MAIAQEYGGQQVAPQVGAGAQGASFQAMEAPKADLYALDKGVRAAGMAAAKYLDDVNEAIATDADTRLTQYQQDLLYNEQTGFMGRKGYDALRADDEGVSPLDSMMKSFKGAVEAACAGKTAAQQKLIRAKAAGLTNSLYATGLQHTFQENHQFLVNTATAGIKQQAVVAANNFDAPDVIQGSIAKAKANAARIARLNGTDAKQAQIDAEAGIHHNVVMGFINAAHNDPTNWAKARLYLQSHSKAMTPDDIFAFDALISAGQKKFEAYETANEVFQELKTNTTQYARASGKLIAGDTGYADGDANYVFYAGIQGDQFALDSTGRAVVRTTTRNGESAYGIGGLTKSMAEAALGRQLTDEQWASVREDPSANAKISKEFLNRLGVHFGDTSMALAAYFGSAKEVEDAKAKAAKDGGVWAQYLSKDTQSALNGALKRMKDSRDTPLLDENGNAISAFDPRYATKAYVSPTQEQVRKLIEQNPLSVDPEWKETAIQRTLAMFESDKQDFANRQQTALDRVCQIVEQGGEPTEADLAQLDYKSQLAFRNWKKAHDANDPTGDRAYFAYLVKNPSVVHGMTKEEVRNATRAIPKAGRQLILKEWEAGQVVKQGRLSSQFDAQKGGNPIGKTSATMGLVSRVLKREENFAKLDEDQQALIASEVMLQAAADNAIYGIDTSDTVKAEAYVLDLLKKTYNKDTLFGTYAGDKKPIVSFKWGDYDSWTKNVGKKLAERYFNCGEGNASQGQAMASLLRLMVRKEPGLDCSGILSAQERAEAQDLIRAAVRADMAAKPAYAQMRRSDFDAVLEKKISKYINNDAKLLRAYLENRMGEN